MTRLILWLCVATVFLSSCKGTSESQPIDPEFVFCLFNKEENPTSFLFVADLKSSSAPSLEIPLSSSGIREREYIQKDGFFYRLSNKTKVLSKYVLRDAKLERLDSVLLKNGDMETFTWKDNDNLVFVCRDDVANRTAQARIYEIDTKAMHVLREGSLTLPYASGDYRALHVGLVEWEGDQLWLAYSFFKSQGKYGYTTSDTTYYATIDARDFRLQSIQKEVRSTYPGGYNVIQSYSFKDEVGDYYFMTNPGIALGNNIKLPTAIFRKQKGQSLVDTAYMLDVSASIGNHAYGIWYVGNGKAVIRNEQKHLYKDFSDHHAVYQFEYRLVDLHTGAMERIPVPLDKGTQKQNVWSDGQAVFIAIDSSPDDHAVWKYDLKTKEATKSLDLPSTTNYIVRMDFLK